jgi:hypothetical protein
MENFSWWVKNISPGTTVTITPSMVFYQFDAGYWTSGTSTIGLTGTLSKDLDNGIFFDGFVSGVNERYNFDRPGLLNEIGKRTPGRPFQIEWVGRRGVTYSYPP